MEKIERSCLGLLTGLLMLCIASPAAATTETAYDYFSISQNPNSSFAFGRTTTSAGAFFRNGQAVSVIGTGVNGSVPVANGWSNGTNATPRTVIWKNEQRLQYIAIGGLWVNDLTLQPEGGTDSFAAIQFTALANARYSFSGAFFASNSRFTASDIFIRQEGAVTLPLLDRLLLDPSRPPDLFLGYRNGLRLGNPALREFDFSLDLSVGDQLVFGAGEGLASTAGAASTGFELTVSYQIGSPVTEPASALLLCGGLLALLAAGNARFGSTW